MNKPVDQDMLALLARKLSAVCGLVEQEYIDPVPDIVRFRLHGAVDLERLDMIAAGTLFLEPVTRLQGPTGWELIFMNWGSVREPSVICVEEVHAGFWQYSIKEAP